MNKRRPGISAALKIGFKNKFCGSNNYGIAEMIVPYDVKYFKF